MEQSILAKAAQTGNTEAFYALLQQNPYLLDDIDKIPFVDTPLHISASAGFTHFALEILTLKSSFGKKLNPDGFSPIDLALRFGHAQTVKRLVDDDPHLIGVKGKERFTALHYVAEVDDVDLLAEFLVKSPKSVEDLTIRGETAVHVAVRNRNVRALKVLLGFLQLTEKEEILNWEDENGDTVLHIAASTNNIEVVRLLVGKVNINHKNQAGLTALDIAIEHYPAADGKQIERILGSAGGRRSSTVPKIDSLADVLSSNVSSSTRKLFKHNTQVELGNFGGLNNLSGDTRNALLVVAVLITTATYQAMLSPPGGFSSGGGSADTNTHTLSKSLATQLPRNGAGMADIGGKVQMKGQLFLVFLLLNTLPFLISLRMIVSLMPRTKYNSCLVLLLLSLFNCYAFSGMVTSAGEDFFSVYLFAFAFLLFLFLVFYIVLDLYKQGLHFRFL